MKHQILLVNYYSAEDQEHAHERDLTIPYDNDIPYEAALAPYMENYQNPPERENYEFAGWYLDKGCTKRADTATMTMPAESLALYAKWDLKYYFVEIDPNGGEMEDQTEFSEYTGITSPRKQSTYTWLQYGQKLAEYANVERNYVPDEHGNYVYVNVKFAEDFAAAQGKDWDLSLPSKCRAAFYCLESELSQVYAAHFQGTNLSWEDFNAYCIDKNHKYRRAEGVEGYTLAAWYKVNDDGTTSNELYNFHDIVTKPTRIRAVWRKTGEYYIQYDPFMRGYNIGRVVEKDGQTYVNPVTYEPIGVNDPAQHVDKLADNAEIEIDPAPEHIPPNYTFKGWQLLDHDGNYADNVPTKLVHEKYNIDSSYADQNGAIHFEAVYEPEAASVRRVPTASLVLDASGGRVQRNDLDIYEENKIYVDLVNDQVLFTRQPNNFDVNLKDYYENFLNDDGKVLVGWSKKQNPTEADINFKADDIIGVDINNNDTDNILYAVWEPMYYLTLENYSTEFDVTFTLSFTGNGENNKGLVYCYADEEGGTHLYERHLLSSVSHENITAVKQGDNLFKITMKRATKEGDVVHPNSERLVLPEGATATYTVSGNVGDVKMDDNTSLKNKGVKLSVYNSGGASKEMTPVSGSDNNYVYDPESYSVAGSMKLGNEGQKIAFYTGDTTQTNIYISAAFCDPANAENGWKGETQNNIGPNATLQFVEIQLGSDTYTSVTDDRTQGITGLSIIQGQSSTFGISESYTNSTQYKFIGWYDSLGATPRDVPIDGAGTNPNYKISGMRVPNEPVKFYYALYVPLADGDITISHDEKQSSIGYPKQMLVRADLGDTHEEQLVTTEIYSIAARNGEKVHTGITFHVSESDTRNITITLGAMSGYGCVYSNTYEGLDMLDRTETDTSHAHYFADGGIAAVVYYNPTETQYAYTPGEDIGNGETKHLYKHIITKKVSDLFEESETVKGYKILRDLTYTSDFERKYEFVYNYKFRDGTTQRRSVVTGSTAVYNSDDDFTAFVFKSAPYITNFGEDLEWDLASIKVEKLLDKGRVTATMDAVHKKRLAKVMVKTEGSAIEIPHQVSVGETFPVGQMPTAELIRNGTQFFRWEIKNTATKELIGYCYWHEFTFKVWDDITITAQYVPLGEDGEYHRYYPDNETTSYITIQHLESTRNSWVALDEKGEIIRSEKDLPKTYYDTLYDDYSILFVDKGLRINTNAGNYKVGLIYEIVGEIEDEEVPEAYSRTPDPELRMRALQAVVKKGNDTYGTINSGGKPKFYYSQFDPAELSNDNRMEFYRGINNLKTEAGLNPNAKYVFDVYAYMQLPNGEIIQSEQPITLQLYRLAVKETTQ